MSTVTVLGLGAMGSRMAQNLLDSGHDVTVYNRSDAPARAFADQGATRAATPKEAAAASEVVISMVTDDDASRNVWLGDEGAVRGLQDGAVAVESSTLTPEWVRDLDVRVREVGATLLDAPVLGTRPQAESASLIYFVGGPESALERVRPVLQVLGDTVHAVGDVSKGMTMKLAVNALFGIQVAAAGELLGFLREAGIDAKEAVDVLGDLPVTSAKAKVVMGLMAEETFDPLFPIDLVEKDFRYVVGAATEAGADVPTSRAVRDVYRRAKEAGFGPDNIAGVAKLFSRTETDERGLPLEKIREKGRMNRLKRALSEIPFVSGDDDVGTGLCTCSSKVFILEVSVRIDVQGMLEGALRHRDPLEDIADGVKQSVRTYPVARCGDVPACGE